MVARSTLASLFPKVNTPSRPKQRRARELKAWGLPTSPELVELAALHDAGTLPADLGELRPFAFAEPVFPPTKGFGPYLLQAQEFGWPVFFLAHFAGLFPIGATRGGDFWLARVTADPGGSSRVYRYDHETGELQLAFRSIAALIVAALGDLDVVDIPVPRGAPPLAPADDPESLWTRASWAADLIGASALERWTEGLSAAPTLTAFQQESAQLARRPELAAYWLLAHALLGNVAAFEDATRLTAQSKNPFVVALRPRARILLGPSKLAALALGTLRADDVVQRLAELRKVAPKSLRSGTPPALPATGPAITVESVTRLAQDGELLAFMAMSPTRDTLHVWALHHIALWAERDRGPIEVLERIADFGLTPARLQQQTTWLSMDPLVKDSGQREAQLLELLVGRRSPRAAEFIVHTLTSLECSWWRIELAAKAAALAAELEVTAARPILERMIANETWQRYPDTAMRQFNAALATL
ncbi:MAG: hypothetical protein Q8N26_10545 [Myxococcales bacterium]|nr:hypothetical protein [Myxococcales bacterium]